MYKFAILDPRNISAAIEANNMVFANSVYGVEVTIPALAKRCAFNLDPQHTGGDANRAAIEDAAALVIVYSKGRPCCGGGWDSYYCPKCDGTDCPPPIPAPGATLATVRADLDSVGAMAIFSLFQKKKIAPLLDDKSGYCPSCGMGNEGMLGCCMICGYREGECIHSRGFMERLSQVATADKFARGGYFGPKPLPTRSNPWDESSATAESSRPLAAIAAAIMDFKVPMADRVSTMERWLLTGDEPVQYHTQVEKERLDMITAMETGQIKSETRFDNRIAVVESTHRAATSVGYSLAPVVVALNPSFKQGPSEPYKKFTICAFEAKFADIKSALAELATLEDGWGGSPTIGGSPQGVSSNLTINQVVEVVAKHLR